MMNNLIKSISIIGLILIFFGCSNTEELLPEEHTVDILTLLKAIDGATVSELPASDHFDRIFEVLFLQPVNHLDPDGPSFQQKVYIGHVDLDAPVVLETEGYARSVFKTRKLAALSQSNQVSVEHRYYGQSIPSSFSWDAPLESNYLTVRQAADDIHKVVEALNQIYTSPWVSSGRSKGGSTAVYHRRFYPKDVVGTVPIVAPLLFAKEDPRYIDGFFEEVGTSECRQKVKDFQRAILEVVDSLPVFLDGDIDFINMNYGTDFFFTYPKACF